MDAYTWISLFLTPLTGVITWFASRRVRNNSTLQQMQETIDMLVKKNADLYEEIAQVRKENASLIDEIAGLNRQLTEIRRENASLIAGQTRISEENAFLKKQFEKKPASRVKSKTTEK